MRERRAGMRDDELRGLWWFICCSYIGIAHTHSLSGVDCCEKSSDVKGVIHSEGFSLSFLTCWPCIQVGTQVTNNIHREEKKKKRKKKSSAMAV